jgi:hypothetical protein
LECASLLAPCFAAACCRSAKSPNSRGEASFALEFEHFAGTEARVLLTRAEGPAVNSPPVRAGDWESPRSEGPALRLCRTLYDHRCETASPAYGGGYALSGLR